jgi:predicted transcriptional regulator
MIMPTEDELALLHLLSDMGSRRLEELVELSGLSPAQVLLAVDRLSRSGHIVLRKEGMDYHVTRSAAA